MNTIYTIGHSNHSIATFAAMLQAHSIQLLADIRSMPGSKWSPQFNSHVLERSLKEAGIAYKHLPDLGGKRKTATPTDNTADVAIPGYGAYMQTNSFATGIAELEEMAIGQRVAYMCAEANWRNCHRSMVSDHLKVRGWRVVHILPADKWEEHPDHKAKPTQGSLFG